MDGVCVGIQIVKVRAGFHKLIGLRLNHLLSLFLLNFGGWGGVEAGTRMASAESSFQPLHLTGVGNHCVGGWT